MINLKTSNSKLQGTISKVIGTQRWIDQQVKSMNLRTCCIRSPYELSSNLRWITINLAPISPFYVSISSWQPITMIFIIPPPSLPPARTRAQLSSTTISIVHMNLKNKTSKLQINTHSSKTSKCIFTYRNNSNKLIKCIITKHN